jgi:hypothetical protein
MKKFRFPALALAGALTLSLLLAACGSSDAQSTPTPEVTDTPDVVETVEASVEPTDSALPKETPAEESKAPSQSAPAQSAAPSASTTTQAPSQAPAASSVSVESIWDSISSAMELPAFMDMDADILSALYGIDESDLVEYVGKIPMMNVQATEFFIAKVQSGKMDAVKAGIAQRQADLVTQWESYLPEQLELVKNYKLVTSGDYILFAISETADQAVSIFTESFS